MTRVKICGITNKEDARAAVNYGADALGFVQVPKSPRFITIYMAEKIIWNLPPFVQTVVLVADCQEEAFPLNLQNAGFSALQFYEGDCTTTSSGLMNCIRAFRMRDESSLTEIESHLKYLTPNAILLDTYHKDKLGGSGETFNWDLAVEAKRRFDVPIILAGGLTADNVTEAIAKVQPYAVDVSSGVEAEPGRKDHAKMKAFIRAVRRADL